MSKRPAFQFYPSDWRNDAGLRLCSIGARGLWMDMLCLMHEGQPYGFLNVQGRSIAPEALARLVGESAAAVKRWLKELAENDVYSVDETGAIFSRRMVRDEDLRERRAEIGRANGAKGGAFGHLGADHGRKGGRPKSETPVNANESGGKEPPQNPRPSSSSSSSSSSTAGSQNRAREIELPADVKAVLEAGGYVSPPSDLSLLREWIAAGAMVAQDVVPVIEREAAKLRRNTGQAPRTLKVFDAAIREKLAADEREIDRLKGVTRRYSEPSPAAAGAVR